MYLRFLNASTEKKIIERKLACFINQFNPFGSTLVLQDILQTNKKFYF